MSEKELIDDIARHYDNPEVSACVRAALLRFHEAVRDAMQGEMEAVELITEAYNIRRRPKGDNYMACVQYIQDGMREWDVKATDFLSRRGGEDIAAYLANKKKGG